MNSQNQRKQATLSTKFWLVALVAFINSVSFTIIIPLLYPYAKKFGLSDFEASLLTSAYAISQFIGTPILGRLSDRLGRKPLLVLSLFGTVIANIIAGIAPVAWMLFTARILDGLTGGNTSIAIAVISDITTPEQRPRAFGIFDAVFRLGFVAGPTLSYFAQQLPPLPGISSLGMSFLIAGGIALIAMLMTAFLLPETRSPSKKPKFELNLHDFGFSKAIASVTRPKLGSFFILTFLTGSSFAIFTFAFQPFVLNVLNQDAGMLAIIFASIGMLGFISQIFALEPLRARFNLIDILFGSLALRGLTFILIPTFPNLTAFFIIISIFALANAFPMPTIASILSLNAKEGEQGEVLGTNASYLSISNGIGPVISGILVSFGYKLPLWITGIFTLATAWFAFTLKAKCDRTRA